MIDLSTLRSRVGQGTARFLIDRQFRWKPMTDPRPGYSILLGTPWDLVHLLPVNLRFIERMDLTDLDQLFVVFDRCHRDGMDEVEADMKRRFPSLPLRFMHYPEKPGRLVERLDISTFYNSMNTVLALSECRTRHYLLHDFDLYPIDPSYFRGMYEAMRDDDLHFTGLEFTPFYELTEDDAVIGTWALGMDAEWVRSKWRPIHCFHKMHKYDGRWIKLDPYSWLQLQTTKRRLAGEFDGRACHVKNLCSTYLRFSTGRPARIAWRLHYLWYLESIEDQPKKLTDAIAAMEKAAASETPALLTVGDVTVDFTGTDPTCANVLRSELGMMETALFDSIRPEVTAFIDGFEAYLRSIESDSPAPAVPAV